ncbi:MAG TPA: metallophosphoesterase [Polyangiaceae bacterium]|nr:metallophosphoesterase [Polyangiaceae bacterium]
MVLHDPLPDPLTVGDILVSENDEGRFRKIQLRRFAGPRAYAGAMDPIRIAHLTDLHVGRVTPMRIQNEAVLIANAAKPDFVFITGDFVCHSQRFLDQLETIIAAFTSPVVCVLGNHDHWSGADEVRHSLQRAGALVLDNQHTTLQVRHQRLQVVGLDDAYTTHADRDRAVRGLRHDLPSIALSHIAEEADGLWAAGIPLVLSGHTHAGQITLARLHEIALGHLVGHRYVHGLYGDRRAHGAVYVGAGLGAAVMPVRIGARARREITIFELGTEPGTFAEDHDEQEALPGRAPTARTMMKRFAAVQKKRLRRERRG